jgi:hypothetical protein
MMTLNWTPRCSLGPFLIGGSIGYVTNFVDILKSDDLHVDFLEIESYVTCDGALRFEVCKNIIESVSSESEFLFDGNNIIGMSVHDVESLLKSEADEADSTESKDDPIIVDFVDLGLQLVVNNNLIVSATCY